MFCQPTSNKISEKVYKEVWELELQMIQKECDAYVAKYNTYLIAEKENAFKEIDNISKMMAAGIPMGH